jgi:hypothetical protein
MALPRADLLTARDRPVVKIDGATYQLRTSNDLTLEVFRRLERDGPRLTALLARVETDDQLTQTDEGDLTALLAELCADVLLAPARVLARLQEAHRLAIYTAFSKALAAELAEQAAVDGEASSWDEVIPRLQRFYGGTALGWMTELPLGVLRACLAQLPRLRAEEDIALSNAVALGTGSLQKDSADALSRSWRAAIGRDRRVKVPPTSPVLSGMGIGTRLRPKPPAAQEVQS